MLTNRTTSGGSLALEEQLLPLTPSSSEDEVVPINAPHLDHAEPPPLWISEHQRLSHLFSQPYERQVVDDGIRPSILGADHVAESRASRECLPVVNVPHRSKVSSPPSTPFLAVRRRSSLHLMSPDDPVDGILGTIASSHAARMPAPSAAEQAAAVCPWADPSSVPLSLVEWSIFPVDLIARLREHRHITTLYPWQRDCLFEYYRRVADDILANDGLPSDSVQRSSSPQRHVDEASASSCTSSATSTEPLHLIYCAPTSGGKTLVAELLLLRTVFVEHDGDLFWRPSGPRKQTGLLNRRYKAIYVVPYVALATEKCKQLELMCVGTDKIVQCHAGDRGHLSIDGADIHVCTNEKAYSLWRSLEEENRTDQVAVVVIDELHHINDETRGLTLELFITRLVLHARHSPRFQLIGLSATLSNAEVLARWCGRANLFVTAYRPVELSEHYVVGSLVYNASSTVVRDLTPLINNNREKQSATADGVLPTSSCSVGLGLEQEMAVVLAMDAWADKYQVLLFTPTRRSCEVIAQQLYRHVADQLVVDANHRVKKRLLMQQLRDSERDTRLSLQRLLEHGVAFHHGAMGSNDRRVVEDGFRERHIWALCCTTTLSTGVNLPCRRVIFTSPRIGQQMLDVLRYKQAAGRAGRAGLDAYGESFLVGKPHERALLRHLVSSTVVPIGSNFGTGKRGLTRVILDILCLRDGPATMEEVHDAIAHTLLAHTEGVQVVQEATLETLRLLREQHFVRYDDDQHVFAVTPLGAATASSFLAPDEALWVLRDLESSARRMCLANDLHLVYLCTPIYHGLEPDWQRLCHEWFPSWTEVDEGAVSTGSMVCEAIGINEGMLLRWAMTPPPVGSLHEDALRCRRFFAALLLTELVHERPMSWVARRYGLRSVSDLQQLSDHAARFASAVSSCSRSLNWWYIPPLMDNMIVRLRCGVEPELIPLMSIDGLTAWRARALYQRGYRTVLSVAAASTHELMSIFQLHTRDSYRLDGSWSAGATESYVDQGSETSSEALMVVQHLHESAIQELQRQGHEAQSVVEAAAATVPSTTHALPLPTAPSQAMVKTESLATTSAQVSSKDTVETMVSCTVAPTTMVVDGGGATVHLVDVLDEAQVRRMDQTFKALCPLTRLSGMASVQRGAAATLHSREMNSTTSDTEASSSSSSSMASSSTTKPCVGVRVVRGAGAAARGVAVVLILLTTTTSTDAIAVVQESKPRRAVVFVLCSSDVEGMRRATAARSWFLCLLRSTAVEKICFAMMPQLHLLRQVGWMSATRATHLMQCVHDPLVAAWMLNPDIDYCGEGRYALEDVLSCHSCQASTVLMAMGPLSYVDASSMERMEGYSSIFQRELHDAIRRGAAAIPVAHQLVQQLHCYALFHSYSLREMPITVVCFAMEAAGVSFDATHYTSLAAAMREKVHELIQRAYEAAGRSNWNLASPQDCAKVLYDDLELPCLERTDDGTALPIGVPKKRRRLDRESRSTRASALKQLSRRYPHLVLPEVLMEYRRLDGWIDKYMSPLLEAFQRSHSGRVCGSIFTTTATGRLAMSEPSLQTIPHPITFVLRGERVEVCLRRAFVAPPGYVLLSADYAQIEARILAHYSRDPELLAAFRSASESTKGDLFTMMAAQLNHSQAAEVRPEDRRVAKTLCYGIIYGKGRGSIADDLEISVEEADSFLTQFKRKYRVAMNCIGQLVKESSHVGYVTTMCGRKRWLPYANSSNPSHRAASERVAINTLCQGTAADIIKEAMLRIAEDPIMQSSSVAQRDGDMKQPRPPTLLLQVHDELLFEVPQSRLMETISVVRRHMNLAKDLRLEVDLPVRFKSGPTWGDLHPVAANDM